MIEINGLTKKQVALMEVMWSYQDKDAVDRFIQSLPKRDQQDCQSMIDMVMLDLLEDQGYLDFFANDAENVIDSIR